MFLRYMESQFLNENFADIYFVINTDEQTVKIPSHKVILAAGSLSLEKRFIQNTDLNKIEIVNSTPAAFDEFLFTFYSSDPEKNFTIANVPTVLTLGKTFEVVHCIKSVERYLLKKLTVEQLCFGYSLAMEFSLLDLKSHCMKQINEKKRVVFATNQFLACNQEIFNNILENVTVDRRDEFEIVWNACVNWAQKQCTLQSIDASNMKNLRVVFGKSLNQIQTILSKDGEFFGHIMAQYNGIFDNDENQNDLWSTCHVIVNQTEYNTPNQTQFNTPNHTQLSETQTISYVDENKVEELVFVRFRDTILSPQVCYANVPISIELQSSKRIALNGIACMTISGPVKGKLTIGMRSDNGDFALIDQLISSKPKRTEPNNFIAIENFVLEPNKVYIIKIELSKDAAYRPSRHIESKYQANDFEVIFKAQSHRDIFSHIFFSEIF